MVVSINWEVLFWGSKYAESYDIGSILSGNTEPEQQKEKALDSRLLSPLKRLAWNLKRRGPLWIAIPLNEAFTVDSKKLQSGRKMIYAGCPSLCGLGSEDGHVATFSLLLYG